MPPDNESPVGAAVGNSNGRMIGHKSTMASMAAALTIFLKRPVLEETRLKDHYDFDLKWSAAEAPDGPATPGLGTEGTGLLISNLQSQLGLRLTKKTEPVEYWVVDHIEAPTEN